MLFPAISITGWFKSSLPEVTRLFVQKCFVRSSVSQYSHLNTMYYFRPMSNILFTYQYRNGKNEITQGEIVFPNPENLPLSEVEYNIKSRLTNQDFFHHTHFMVPPLYGQYPDFDKNPDVHEFIRIELTNEPSTDKRNISDFIANIK
jgi:hypothetical protein